MKMVGISHMAATLVFGGLTMGTALLGAGIAAAAPTADIGPLVNSTCSFHQIEGALHRVAPDTAAKLDADPVDKMLLQGAFNQPPAQRRAAFQMLLGQRPQLAPGSGPEFDAKLRQVANSCHSY